MAATIDATVGGASSNSYATLVEANAYMDERLYVDEWDSATDDNKNRALIQATRIIDTNFSWQGSRVDSTQALDWPRTGVTSCDTGLTLDSDAIPEQIKHAQFEQALYLLKNTASGETTSGEIKRAKIDVIEVEYFDGGSVSASTVKVPDSVMDFISCLGDYEGESNGRLVRY